VRPVSPSPAAARPVPVGSGGGVANRPLPAKPIPVSPGAGALVRDDEADEEGQADPAAKAVKAAPPWLVSLVFHMVVLIVLGLIYLPQIINRNVELEVTYAEEEGIQLIDDQLATNLMEQMNIDEPALAIDMAPVDDPLAAPPELLVPSLEGVHATDTIEAPSIGMALTGREKGMKQALLGAYGGTATTEAAVRDGLEWLKRNQLKSGLWSLSGPYNEGTTTENELAATAMALLAFQGAGNTPSEGEFKQTVAKGWKALLEMQDKDGNFFRGGGAHNHRLYSQAQATIAICELYGMTKDPKYREPAQLAIDYAVKIQSPEGGWRYEPKVDADLSVTGWFVMALQSALMAGLEVPSPTFDNVTKFLDSVQLDGGREYCYMPGQGSRPSMTAEGLLCRQYIGWKFGDERLQDGCRKILANPITYDDPNVYYWYYATQVLHHMGGEMWDEWNEVMREDVPRNQVKTGPERGSWNPADDRWGNHGGRLFVTCLSIYMLEVYYRHLPLYKHQVF
jgi:hypothetical protein